jgi:hypothetical protein
MVVVVEMPAQNSPSEVSLNPLDERVDNLLFGVRRSIRYHNHRRRFFDGFDKVVKVLSVVGGSGAVVSAISSFHGVTIALAALIAFLSAISLVVGPAQAARLHEELAKRFSALEHAIASTSDLTADRLQKFEADRLLIEAQEPPIMRVLDSQCHNELCRAMGYPDCEFVQIGPFQAFFSQIVDLWPSQIKKKET